MFALVSAVVDEQVGRAPVAGAAPLATAYPGAKQSAGRKNSCAVLPSWSRISWVFFCPGIWAPMRAQEWVPSGHLDDPWLATVAPLDPLPTRSLRMVMMVSSSAELTGVWVS